VKLKKYTKLEWITLGLVSIFTFIFCFTLAYYITWIAPSESSTITENIDIILELIGYASIIIVTLIVYFYKKRRKK